MVWGTTPDSAITPTVTPTNTPAPVNTFVITASNDNPPYETKDKAFDGNNMTKWLSFESNPWIRIEYGAPVTIYGYAISAANDYDSRDPKD